MNKTKRGKTILAAALTLACFVGALCCGTILGAFGYECYDGGVESYFDTRDYQEMAKIEARDLMYYYVNHGLQTVEEQYDPQNTNYRYEVTRLAPDGAPGEVLLTTIDEAEPWWNDSRGWFCFAADPNGEYDYNVLGFGEWNSQMESAAQYFMQRLPAAEDQAVPACYLLQLVVSVPVTVNTYSDYDLYDHYHMFRFLFGLRHIVFVVLAVCAVVALVSLILLLAGAGRLAGRDEVVFTWFDRIPMELSFAGLVSLGVLSALLVWEGVPRFVDDAFYWVEKPYLAVCIAAVCGLALVFTQWVMSAVAWLLALVRAAKSGSIFCNFGCVRFFVWVQAAVRYLPLLPKVAALAAGFVVLNGVTALSIFSDSYIRLSAVSAVLLVLLAVVWLAAGAYLLHGAYGLKKLQDCACRITRGDYSAKVDTRWLPHHLYAHAQALENIAAGLNAAVDERMKSERLKTELITNVSHDLKTPLTSIINYTDLLQSQPLPEQAAEYAEVLARQSQRLKKLTEDLVEASKASSGVMTCEKQPTDLAELCGQALGEYSARLETAGLTPILTMPETGLWADVDGRLVWRTLDNLLGNACKYAQPGTRLYLNGQARDGQAVIGVKNISREALNISADELMERFVRGDSSRSTEGSGLGLSIARSLCELQGGTFHLTVDGDLFKAEIRFARCEEPAASLLPEGAPQ